MNDKQQIDLAAIRARTNGFHVFPTPGSANADLVALLAAYDALLAAAKKVTCKRCDDSGVEPWSDFGGAAAESCPDCTDLRRLLGESHE